MFNLSRFGELLGLLPRGVFERAVEQNKADRYRKSFSCWQQLVAMLYVQFRGASSLRVVESGFNALLPHHYHLGCKTLHRSTLADSNAKAQAVPAFEQLAGHLMQQVRGKVRQECRELLQIIDSSSVTVKGPGAQWAKHTRTKHAPGVKLHVVFEGEEAAPLAVQISDGNVSDVEYANQLSLEDDTTYVFDRGYCDYGLWWRIEQKSSRFVTRFKRNAKLEVVKERGIPKNAAGMILKDEEVRFANKRPGAGRVNPYTKMLRRIEVAREGKPALVLATNDMKSSALKISQRYKQRWQIELFFKWIKQHLKIKQLLGRSKSAVSIQILSALIAYLLVWIYKSTHKIKKSLWMLLAEIASTLFERTETQLHRHRRWREARSEIDSLQASLFT